MHLAGWFSGRYGQVVVGTREYPANRKKYCRPLRLGMAEPPQGTNPFTERRWVHVLDRQIAGIFSRFGHGDFPPGPQTLRRDPWCRVGNPTRNRPLGGVGVASYRWTSVGVASVGGRTLPKLPWLVDGGGSVRRYDWWCKRSFERPHTRPNRPGGVYR